MYTLFIYIFQPFNENENVPMYYRTRIEQSIQSKMSLYNYIKSEKKNLIGKTEEDSIDEEKFTDDKYYYNFDEVMDLAKVIGIDLHSASGGKPEVPDEQLMKKLVGMITIGK